MKKFLALALALVMLFAFAACGGNEDTTDPTDATDATDVADASNLKVGVILIGDENEGYSKAHIDGITEAAEACSIPAENITWKYTVAESSDCYEAAADLADSGCDLVIANSYGFGPFVLQAAQEFPDVDFLAMTGDEAAISGVDNLYNAFTNIYEARYVSGVVAGMKIKELVDAGELTDANYDADGNVKIGYVGAFPYAEIKSGYTAFFLGVKSVYEKVSMDVQFTNSWFSIDQEAAVANQFIADGCVIIGQHADSHGAPQSCQTAQKEGKTVFSIGYNVSMLDVAPDAALTSATNNWAAYYEYLFTTKAAGEEIAKDWAKGFADNTVGITELNAVCAEGTQEKVDEVIAGIKDGSIKVFDTSTFTVDGKEVTTNEVDLTPFGSSFKGEVVETIVDGAFEESTFRSAPYFVLDIDGIEMLNG